MDAREGDWKKAVETDGLTWIQACDYKNTAGEVARAYNITAIPRVLVLDKNNRVIADSKPVKVCQNARAKRCTMGRDNREAAPDWGYCASQGIHYYGYKLHAVCGIHGVIHSYDMTAASIHDLHYLKNFNGCS